jgi:hypothetical protein
MQPAVAAKPRLYAYIDETGDEGFPGPPIIHSDPLAYRCAERHDRGPSPYFAIGAALVRDSDRTTVTNALRAAAAKIYPTRPNSDIHWKGLELERKQAVIDSLKGVPFKWLIAKSHKPTLPRTYRTPYLYNYMTRLAIERCDTEARLQRCDLVLVFAHRRNTNYADLTSYIRREVDCRRLVGIQIEQAKRLRLLQLADIVCGVVKDATYRNRYGRVDLDNLRAVWHRLHRYNNVIWGYGVKAYPEDVDPHYAFAAHFYQAATRV